MLAKYFMLLICKNTPPTEIYTLSLHDALPICGALEHSKRELEEMVQAVEQSEERFLRFTNLEGIAVHDKRSEEHTSELQSQSNLVCRLLLEKKKESLQPPHAALPHPLRRSFVL